MNRELLSKAFGEIDDRFIAEAVYLPAGDASASPERKHMKTKRILTLALAAALILSLGIAGFAAWSIHSSRQQELRTDLKIEEGKPESYVEFPVADADANTAGVVLLSAINDGQEERIYLNVSPVAEEKLARFPEEARFFCMIEGTEYGGFAAPKLPAELSLSGQDEIRKAVKEYSYDSETQTLTLEAYLMTDVLKKAMQELGTERIPLQVNMAVGEETLCFGKILFSPTEEQHRFFDFGHARYYDRELDKEIEILGLKLTPFSAEWIVHYEEDAKGHTPGADPGKYSSWYLLEDKVCIEAKLHFSDGSTFSTGGAVATPYQDGAVHQHCSWGSAIDIEDVQRITLGDLTLWERASESNFIR